MRHSLNKSGMLWSSKNGHIAKRLRRDIGRRAISTFLIKQAGLRRAQAATGAVTLIQRFGSAANLNIHLHCLVMV